MSGHTTLNIGGPADWYAEAANVEQLRALLKAARENGVPCQFIGWGSNLLVSDKGIPGLVIRLRGEFESVSFAGGQLRAGAGVFLPNLVKLCSDRGLGGVEPLVGVPGTVGGALVMNAGTSELEIGDVVKTVEVLDLQGNLELLRPKDLEFGYRRSSLEGRVICFATLELRPKDRDDITRTIQKLLEQRLKTQPVGSQNVGSIFKNPKGDFAARLIERAGFKGRRVGGAEVSAKHANFIVNAGGATAADVRALISAIQEAVQKMSGVLLETEIKMIGKWP